MTEPELIAEQLRHAMDLVKAENQALKTQMDHDREVFNLKVQELEKFAEDVESRLRSVTDGVTQFKVLAGLATGGGLLSIIALIKALMGN